MGFSVSGSFAVLVVSAFIAFGAFHGALSDGFDRVSDAQRIAYDDRLDGQNTAIDVTRAEYETRADPLENLLTVEVENTGATTLSVNATDVVVDNRYFAHDEFDVERVEGDAMTGLWQPGETYHVEINETVLSSELELPLDPQRVKIVVGPGVPDSREVVDT